MTDLFKMADIFVSKVNEDYKNDVAIVGYYGSYSQGTQNSKSDFDIFLYRKLIGDGSYVIVLF
jgi:predicted nucleotidyltransferase